MRHDVPHLLCCLLLLLGGMGCEGVISDPSAMAPVSERGPGPDLSPDEVADLCAEAGSEVTVGRTPFRRLNRAEFDNTVSVLLGIDSNPSAAIAPDERIGPFYSNAIAPITDLLVRQHMEVATSIAAEAMTDRDAVIGCDVDTEGEDVCADRFIERFGRRAFRRPLDGDELSDYQDLYVLGRDLGGFNTGIRLVLEAMLQSPVFLYHVEVGEAGAPSNVPSRLTSYELASRLSYFLWTSTPDDELLDAADADLHDPAVLRTQVERMLEDDRAADAISSFHLQWLGIGDMLDVEKDPELFPQYDATLREAMRDETAQFADYVIRRGDGKLSTLLTAPFSIIDGPLFELYGVEAPAGHDPAEPVDLDPTRRAGLITQAGFLATHAHRNQTSPVHRGIVIRENFLCHPIPSPPPTVDNTPPPPTPATTTRERFRQHEEDPVCGSCHILVDRIGLGFEHYDPVGEWRDVDGPQPVDARGEIVQADEDLEGEFDGAVELAHQLAGSDQVSSCIARQWFRFALGRIESNDDACSLDGVYDGFFTTDYDVRELMVAIVTSDAFRHVRLVGTEEEVAP